MKNTQPIFELKLKNKDNDIYVEVTKDWDRYYMYARNHKTNTTVALDFEELREAINRASSEFVRWIKF